MYRCSRYKACLHASPQQRKVKALSLFVFHLHTQYATWTHFSWQNTNKGWAMWGSLGRHRLRCMAKNRSRDSLVGECERRRRVLISFHYCGVPCCTLLLPVFGSSCRVINGCGQTGAGKRPARWRKVGDRLLNGVRSNWLKWLSALRYWCVSPVHHWRGRPWWGVTVAFTGHHLKDQERLGNVDRMHEKTPFVRFFVLHRSHCFPSRLDAGRMCLGLFFFPFVNIFQSIVIPGTTTRPLSCSLKMTLIQSWFPF